jgi:hypothetical protein
MDEWTQNRHLMMTAVEGADVVAGATYWTSSFRLFLALAHRGRGKPVCVRCAYFALAAASWFRHAFFCAAEAAGGESVPTFGLRVSTQRTKWPSRGAHEPGKDFLSIRLLSRPFDALKLPEDMTPPVQAERRSVMRPKGVIFDLLCCDHLSARIALAPSPKPDPNCFGEDQR